jgi:D-alanyl-D-alanine endopeptidase (penicillin-binding protein 7)
MMRARMINRLSAVVAPLVVFGLVGLSVPASAGQTTPSTPADKATAKPAAKPAAATSTTAKSTAAAKPAPAKAAPVAPARRPTAAQARAAETSREFANTILPRYKVDASGELVPDLRAAAAIILDPQTNEVLWEENSQSQRSIASITKVMTAVVFFESQPDTSQVVPIVRSDLYQASTTKLRLNDKVTVDDLLHLLLIPSDNAAARALARISPQGSAGFIDAMNRKAAEMGLTNTHYADPSGLLSDNVSSAYDMARLISYASADDRISSIMRTPEYTVRSPRRTFTFRTTNRLLGKDEFDVRAAKTGFITNSGYCLATLVQLPQGAQVAVVVLGARSNAARFLETQNLFTWLSNKTSTIFATATATPTPQD